MVYSLSTLYRSWAFKVTTWLILAAIAGALTFMVWVASAVKPAKSTNKQTNEDPLNADPTALLLTKKPLELNKEVRPIKFDAVIRDMRNYPKEFKDSRFIKSNMGKWTVQVMNVVEHEVVTDYLNGRDDRDKFNYFRIIDTHNQKRFVVTYGVFGSVQEAVGAAKLINFGLPKDVNAFPEEFKLYLPQMDEYEIAPPLRDTGKSAAREVQLKSTPKLLPAPKAKETPQESTKNKTEQNTVKPSIEKSSDRQDTLSIQEGKILVEKSAATESAPERTEPKANAINHENQSNLTKPKPTTTKNTEEKPATKEKPKPKEGSTSKTNDSMENLIKQKSTGNER